MPNIRVNPQKLIDIADWLDRDPRTTDTLRDIVELLNRGQQAVTFFNGEGLSVYSRDPVEVFDDTGGVIARLYVNDGLIELVVD